MIYTSEKTRITKTIKLPAKLVAKTLLCYHKNTNSAEKQATMAILMPSASFHHLHKQNTQFLHIKYCHS